MFLDKEGISTPNTWRLEFCIAHTILEETSNSLF